MLRFIRKFSAKTAVTPHHDPMKDTILPGIPPIPDKQANVIEIVRGKSINPRIKVKTKPKGRVTVGILNANERAGITAAFYLKQHPLIKKVFLHGTEGTDIIANDLNDIDTDASVVGFCKDRELPNALRAADIIILMDFTYKESDIESRFDRVAPEVKYLAEECGIYAPRAVLLNCIEPVCCTMPLIQATFKETALYNPGKIVGCISQVQSRVNSVAAKYFSLDPETVHVPIIGGSDAKTLVPLISLTSPNPLLGDHLNETLYNKLLTECILSDNFSMEKSLMSEGYNIAQLAVVVARGLCGDQEAIAPCLIRTSLVQKLSYIATTVRFGQFGIEHNYGVPRMNKFETRQFVRAINVLLSREKMVKNYIYQNL